MESLFGIFYDFDGASGADDSDGADDADGADGDCDDDADDPYYADDADDMAKQGKAEAFWKLNEQS